MPIIGVAHEAMDLKALAVPEIYRRMTIIDSKEPAAGHALAAACHFGGGR